MRIERNFRSSLSVAEARRRAVLHLFAAHYRQVANGVEMIFERGSILGSVLSFSAESSVVRVYLRPRTVDGVTMLETIFLVSTAGRFGAKNENGYWEGEADRLQVTLESSSSPPGRLPADVPQQEAEYSSAAEYSVCPEPVPLAPPRAPEVQSHVALIFAMLAVLFCVAAGWVVTHSLLGLFIGLLIGAGAACVLMGALAGAQEKDVAIEHEVSELQKPEGTEP